MERVTAHRSRSKFRLKEGAWVFTHPYIRRSAIEEPSECPWLLRSPDTDAYDLLDVPNTDWSIWIGTINKNAQMSVTCNRCKGKPNFLIYPAFFTLVLTPFFYTLSDNTECNLNGQCIDGECVCDPDSGVSLSCVYVSVLLDQYNDMKLTTSFSHLATSARRSSL